MIINSRPFPLTLHAPHRSSTCHASLGIGHGLNLARWEIDLRRLQGEQMLSLLVLLDEIAARAAPRLDEVSEQSM